MRKIAQCQAAEIHAHAQQAAKQHLAPQEKLK